LFKHKTRPSLSPAPEKSKLDPKSLHDNPKSPPTPFPQSLMLTIKSLALAALVVQMVSVVTLLRLSRTPNNHSIEDKGNTHHAEHEDGEEEGERRERGGGVCVCIYI